jgi:hypothetical protein
MRNVDEFFVLLILLPFVNYYEPVHFFAYRDMIEIKIHFFLFQAFYSKMYIEPSSVEKRRTEYNLTKPDNLIILDTKVTRKHTHRGKRKQQKTMGIKAQTYT